MNKYIKTNDNIYLLNNFKTYCDILEKKFYEIKDKHIYLEDIIKRADTIKELCDEIIYILPKQKPKVMVGGSVDDFLNDYDWKNSFIRKIKEGYKYFGAIWIKGKHNEPILKPVAKMNEKGELKLI